MSRLLLNVKSSQAFQDTNVQRSNLSVPRKRLQTDTSLRSPSPQSAIEYEMNRVSPSVEVANTHLYPESSRGLALRLEAMFANENAETAQKGDDLSIHPMQSSSIIQRLSWWMRPRHVGDRHVHIEIADGDDPLEPRQAGGVKESRLGRYDHWL
jgi:hypothetical protein